jgi:hypothetical protein
MLKPALASAAVLAGMTTATTASAGVSNITGTIFVIVMENTNWSQIKGKKTTAPYINSLLTNAQASYANDYNNPPNNHPSEPNYIWIDAGTNYGVTTDNDPTNPKNQIKGKNHFSKQLDTAGISWTAYEENITGTTCPLSSSGEYAAKHNPFVFFDDTTDNFTTTSPTCIKHVRPFTEMAGALTNNTVSKYVFITPNLCDDMHDSCAPTHNRIKQGDTWLKGVVPQIMASNAYKNNGALMITWDEANTGDGPIGFILLSPQAKGKGYSNSIYYTHSSLLRTLEENTNQPLLNDAASQVDVSDLLK